jgi:hypothetical protein
MSKQRDKRNQDKIAAKKAAVLGTAKKSRMPLFGGILVVILIAAAAALMYLNQSDGNPSAIASAPAAAGSTSVSFPARACDVCWPAGKGYYQEGDHMVCRNCGRRFASVLVNEVKGGCNPAPLNRNLENDKLVIKIKDILEGRQYFDFKGKV